MCYNYSQCVFLELVAKLKETAVPQSVDLQTVQDIVVHITSLQNKINELTENNDFLRKQLVRVKYNLEDEKAKNLTLSTRIEKFEKAAQNVTISPSSVIL